MLGPLAEILVIPAEMLAAGVAAGGAVLVVLAGGAGSGVAAEGVAIVWGATVVGGPLVVPAGAPGGVGGGGDAGQCGRGGKGCGGCYGCDGGEWCAVAGWLPRQARQRAAGEGGTNILRKGPEEDGFEQDVTVGPVEGPHLGVLGGGGVY